jgi:hypothetical protein
LGGRNFPSANDNLWWVIGHYLPQMYLRRFTRNGRLTVYDRVTGKLRRDKPRNVAAMTDFYILTDRVGKRDDSVESKFLAQIESHATPVLEVLCSLKPISDEQHGVMAVFVALLCTRIPSFAESYADLNQSLARVTFRRLAGTPERAKDFLARRRRSLPFDPERFSNFVNSDRLTISPDQSERIRLMIDMAGSAVSAFDQMDWTLMKAEPGSHFVTSDGPMGFVPLPGSLPTYGELSPNVLKFVALSPTVCLRLSDRREEQPVLAVHQTADDEVQQINAAIARAATRLIIGCEESHVEGILRATALRGTTFIPRTALVEWYDSVGNRSFLLSVRVHHDTEFPLLLPLDWSCEACSAVATQVLSVSSELKPTNPDQLTQWLDTPCEQCAQTPRHTRSKLSGEEPLHLIPPED